MLVVMNQKADENWCGEALESRFTTRVAHAPAPPIAMTARLARPAALARARLREWRCKTSILMYRNVAFPQPPHRALGVSLVPTQVCNNSRELSREQHSPMCLPGRAGLGGVDACRSQLVSSMACVCVLRSEVPVGLCLWSCARARM